MKNLIKSMTLLAVAALGLGACNEQNLVPEQVGKGELVTVHFGANSSIEPATKATLTTEDEATFSSAWENGENISLYYINGNIEDGTITPSWDSDKSLFSAQLPEYKGEWEYQACYPVLGQDYAVDFGKDRTQKENAYNSVYDIMTTQKITVKNGDQGKDNNGKDVVLLFDRQTGIVYFHFTTTAFDEPLVKATLTVEGGNIASTKASIEDFVFLANEDIDNITITFPESAPSSSDFKLWFNVLPTSYTSMSLHVETTGHTLDITNANTGSFVAGKLYKTVIKEIPEAKWVAKEKPEVYNLITSENDLEDGDYIICMALNNDLTTRQYLINTKGANPSTVVFSNGITLSKDLSSISVYSSIVNNAQWSFESVTDGFSISSVSDVSLGLGTTTGSDGLTIQDTYKGEAWTIEYDSTNSTWWLKFVNTNKYLTVYSLGNPRTYGNKTTNVNGKVFLYKKESTPKTALETPANLSVSAAKVVSWDAVSGAASYNVTIGSETYTSETNSYDAAALEDEYYDVSVVAVPADKDNYKNSAAATLTAVKFGTPTLTTPELTEGAIDESSIRVNMAVDARATNGCLCEIYNGEDLVESKTIKVNYVVFDGLNDGITYTIKVNAIAVEGEKPYVASDVASIELMTKAAQHVSDVTKAGTYTIKGLTVYAVPNTTNAIVGDGTGFILLFKKSHGLKVGNTCDVAGTVKEYNGVWEFDTPSITGKKDGETPVYPDAVEADEAYLASYGTNTKVEYVHAKGTQSGRNIKVGEQTLYMSAENSETDGKNVELNGFVYGYSTDYKNANFVATSISVDNTIPSLSVDQTSKLWASDATDAFVVNVTVNSEGGDWTVTPETLDWATIAVDKTAGTITVTPNGANETETANEAILTVTHASDASLTTEISLKQNGKGGVMPISFSITGAEVTSGTVKFKAEKGKGTSDPAYNPLRLYAKNTITIEDSANPISKIEIEFTKQGQKVYIEDLTADSGTVVSGGTSADASKPVTDIWTSSTTPTKKVVFTLGDKGQRVIKSVKVYF